MAQRWEIPVVGGAIVEKAGDEVDVAAQQQKTAKAVTAGQIEEIQKQAYREGFAAGKKDGLAKGEKEGYETGVKKGQDELRKKISCFESILKTLSRPLSQLDDAIEEELLTLVVTIARQIIRRELKSDPGQIIAVIREAVGALPLADAKVRLFLHPDDAALVRHELTMPEDGKSWQIVEDPVLSRGGCKVATETSQIDATLERRLATLVASVFGDEGRKSGREI